MTNQTIRFTKMHGLGNDFVVINNLNNTLSFSKQFITLLANRYLGIGFDQLLLIEPSSHADFFCRIFNADGSEAEQCGNGLRCIARFLDEEKLLSQKEFRIETKAGVFPVEIKNYDHIQVTMGAPHIYQPFIDLPQQPPLPSLSMTILSIGNPHAVVKVEAIDTLAVDQLGKDISAHPVFTEGVNVGFMQILDAEHIRLRTFERGSGETLACGSNACAAAVAGILNGWLKSPVEIEFKLGKLTIQWDGDNAPVKMTGPATKVYAGEFSI